MSILFESLLARAGEVQLKEMMPPGSAHLLSSIDPQLVYPRNLVKILLELRSPSDLLKLPTTRKIVLELLPREQASVLASLLGASTGSDPYRYLDQIGFKRQHQLRELHNFLGVGLQEEQKVEQETGESAVSPQYPLFDHQITAVGALKHELSVEPFRALLHMPTGSGKTRTAMNIISDYLRERRSGVVVWLAHSEELCQQAAAEFEKAWQILGNREVRVARYWGNYESDLTELRDGIVIAGLSKAFARLKTDDRHFRALSGRAPFVVMDEAHQAIAPTYRQIIDLLVRPMTGARLLGLSATPGRTWNDPDEDEKLSDFFARKKVGLHVEGYDNPIKYLIHQGYLATPIFRKITVNSGLELTSNEKRSIEETFDLPSSVLERLGLNESRNLIVVAEIERLVRRHKRLIVFASSVDQSELLAAVLKARGHNASSVSSRSTQSQRTVAIDEYIAKDEEHRILCNYGVLTTGFDAPQTSSALIARPTLSLVLYSQMIGRALRGLRAGGNKEAEIVTVVDPGLPGFDSVESAFSNWEDVWNQKTEEN